MNTSWIYCYQFPLLALGSKVFDLVNCNDILHYCYPLVGYTNTLCNPWLIFLLFCCFLKTLLSFGGTFWEFSWGRWYWMLLEEDSWQGGEGDGVTGGIRGGCPFTFYIPHQRHYTRKYPRLCQRPIQRINAPQRHWTNIFMDLRYLVDVDPNFEGQRVTTGHFLLLSWFYQHLDNWRMLCEKMILCLLRRKSKDKFLQPIVVLVGLAYAMKAFGH